MTTLTIPNPLPNFAKTAYPANHLLLKKKLSGEILSFWEFTSEVQRLKRRRSPASDVKAVESKARAYRARLIKRRLQQYKLEWIRERRDWKVKTRGKERPEDEKKTDLLNNLSRVILERGRLAKTMISDRVVSEEERKVAVEDLCSLASQDYTTLYRPGEKPVQGLCPVEGYNLSINRYSSFRSIQAPKS